MYKLFMPDIVTMDITMPDMDGIEALEEIIKFNSKANVIMVSALGQETKLNKQFYLGQRDL